MHGLRPPAMSPTPSRSAIEAAVPLPRPEVRGRVPRQRGRGTTSRAPSPRDTARDQPSTPGPEGRQLLQSRVCKSGLRSGTKGRTHRASWLEEPTPRVLHRAVKVPDTARAAPDRDTEETDACRGPGQGPPRARGEGVMRQPPPIKEETPASTDAPRTPGTAQPDRALAGPTNSGRSSRPAAQATRHGRLTTAEP